MKRLWYNLHIHCKFQIFQKLQATAAFLFGLLLGDIGIFYKFIDPFGKGSKRQKPHRMGIKLLCQINQY